MTILVIEPDANLLAEICALLRFVPYHAHGVENASAAWAYLQQDIPHLILCGLSVAFQREAGYVFLQELRAKEAYHGIPVVFLGTGLSATEMRRAMSMGADDYLLKPFSSADLLQTIASRLSRFQDLGHVRAEFLELQKRVLQHYFPHELLTPLNGILGATRLLAKRPEISADPELRPYLTILKHNGLRLAQLIQNQLLYVEIQDWEREGFPDNFGQQRLALQPEIEAIAFERSHYYGRRGDLRLKLAPYTIEMLPKHFQTVVRELIDNAFKFSHAGSPVHLNARAIEDGRIQLRILDMGLGLSTDQIEQIGAYVQFNRQHREQQGMGLGLMLSRRLLSLYGASLEIDSVLGRYTQLTLLLPSC